jgi:thiol-disulfide isomerase/thioredoxin
LISGPVEKGKEVFVLDEFSSHDLATGKYLIVVMATDCSHCRALMEDLIMIADEGGLPPVIALVMNDEEQREDFIDEFEIEFGLYQVPDDDFWRLLEDGEIPRTILIDDGIIIKKWDFLRSYARLCH